VKEIMEKLDPEQSAMFEAIDFFRALEKMVRQTRRWDER
jgi:hypothetical protein